MRNLKEPLERKAEVQCNQPERNTNTMTHDQPTPGPEMQNDKEQSIFLTMESDQNVEKAKEYAEELEDVLSDFEVVKGLSCPLLHIKYSTFDVYWFQYSLVGISFLYHNSPMLEKLDIKLRKKWYIPDIYQKWYSRKDTFNCLPLHLKTVEIVGLYEKCYQYQNLLEFAAFVLKSARVLQEMTIFLDDGCRLDFAFDLSKFLLNNPRRSPNVFVDIQRLSK